MRSSHLVPVVAVLVVAGSLAACSLFVSTDGLSSGGDDAASPTSDSSIDAPSDHPVSPVVDAGADANGDATTTPFCAANPGHSLCFDFDESTAIPPVDNEGFDPGKIFVDNALSFSAPQSLAVIYASGMATNETIERDLQPTSGVLSFEVELRYTASDLTRGQTIALSVDVPHATNGLSQHFFYIQTYNNELDVAETVTPDDGGASDFPGVTLLTSVPADEWLHINVSIDGTTRVQKISLNGTSLADLQVEVGFPSGVAHFSVGGYASDQLPVQTTLHIDNLIVDY
jgi:hypothetical protein